MQAAVDLDCSSALPRDKDHDVIEHFFDGAGIKSGPVKIADKHQNRIDIDCAMDARDVTQSDNGNVAHM